MGEDTMRERERKKQGVLENEQVVVIKVSL